MEGFNLASAMPEECLICSTYHRVCEVKSGRKLGEKAQKSVGKAAETRKDDFIVAALSTVTSVWVSNACYKRYTDPRNVNKTVTSNGNCDRDQKNQSFERRHRSAPFGYRTHCLICEGELNFDLAEKKPDVAKYQISEVSTIINKTKKCKLHERLKKAVAGRTVPLAVELAAKLSYASCIHAEEAKKNITGIVCNGF